MALPGDLTTATITFGPYTDAEGAVTLVGKEAKVFPVNPATGKRLNLVHVATGQAVLPEDLTVTIGSDGTGSIGPVPHTDNAGLSTVGFAYRAEWKLTSGPRTASPGNKTFAVPTAAGATVDFDLLDVAEAAPGVLVPMGIAAGVADSTLAGLMEDVGSETYAAVTGATSTLLGRVATVYHGGSTAVSRPNVGPGTVFWRGDVVPTAMTSSDVFILENDPALLDPLVLATWHSAYYADQLGLSLAEGATVSSWTDATGGTRHLTPNGPLATGSATLLKSVSIYNNKAAVKFNASPLGSPTYTALPQPHSVFIVGNVAGTTQSLFTGLNGAGAGNNGSLYRVFSPATWKAQSGGGAPPAAAAALDFLPHMFATTFSNTVGVGNLRIDGVDFKAPTGGGTRTQFRLGVYDDSTAANLLSGHVAFAGVKAGAFTTDELTKLESWARAKYGITT